jgi:hypothetical protein
MYLRKELSILLLASWVSFTIAAATIANGGGRKMVDDDDASNHGKMTHAHGLTKRSGSMVN